MRSPSIAASSRKPARTMDASTGSKKPGRGGVGAIDVGREQGQGVGVLLPDLAEREGGGADAVAPVVRLGAHELEPRELVEDHLAHALDHGLLVGHVAVERHRLDVELGAQAAHGELGQAVLVDEAQRRLQDPPPVERRARRPAGGVEAAELIGSQRAGRR